MHLSMCFSSLLCIIITEDLVLIRNYIWRSFKNIIFIVLLFFPLLTLSHSSLSNSVPRSPFTLNHLFAHFSTFSFRCSSFIILLLHISHFIRLSLSFWNHFSCFSFCFCLCFCFFFDSISCYSIYHNKGCLKGKHVVILLGLRDKNRS